MEEYIRAIAFWFNPILAIWFFINFISIINKIVKNEDYKSNLWIGSMLLFWFVFSTSFTP